MFTDRWQRFVDIQWHTIIKPTPVTLCTMPVGIIMLPFLSEPTCVGVPNAPRPHEVTGLFPVRLHLEGSQCEEMTSLVIVCCHALCFSIEKTADKLMWYCEVLLVGWSIGKATLWPERDIASGGWESTINPINTSSASGCLILFTAIVNP